MLPQLCLAVVTTLTTCIALGGNLRADEPAESTAEKPADQPTAVFSQVDQYLTPIHAGQFLAAIGYSNLLGVEVTAVEPPLRAHLNLKESQGVVVVSAGDESEAAKAGLKPYDVVLRIDDQEITSPEKFHEQTGGMQGKKVVFHILRAGKPKDLDLTIPNTPVYQFANELIAYDATRSASQYRIGVTLSAADDVLRSQLRLADGEGLVITDIVADGPSAKAGLRRHDVLVKLDGKRVTTVEACNAQIQEIKDRQVTVTLFRAGKEVSLELVPQLSATAEIRTYPYVATVLLNNTDLNADQGWTGRLNVNTLQIDPIQGIYQPNVVRWLETTASASAAAEHAVETTNAATASAAEQIVQLKRQLETMHKSLANLEAVLQSVKPEQKSEQSPKPESEQSTEKPQP